MAAVDDAILAAFTVLFDTAGAGAVPRAEWRRCAQTLGVQIADERFAQFEAKFDPSGSGALDHSTLKGFGVVNAQLEPLLRVLARALVVGLEQARESQAHVEELLVWRERELAKQRRHAGAEHRRRIAGRAVDGWKQVTRHSRFVSRKVLNMTTKRGSATAVKCFHAWRHVRGNRQQLVRNVIECLLLDDSKRLELQFFGGWLRQVRDPAFDVERYKNTAMELNIWTAALGYNFAYWRRKATRKAFDALRLRAAPLRKRDRQIRRAINWRGFSTWLQAVRAHKAGLRFISAFRHPAEFGAARRGLRAFSAPFFHARSLRRRGGMHLTALPWGPLRRSHYFWTRMAKARGFVRSVFSRFFETMADLACAQLLERWADEMPGALERARTRALRRVFCSVDEPEAPSMFHAWVATVRERRLLQPRLLEHRFSMALSTFEALREPALRRRVQRMRSDASRHWHLLGPARLALGGIVLHGQRGRRKRLAVQLYERTLLARVLGAWSMLFAKHFRGSTDERLWLAEERLMMLAESKVDRARFGDLQRAYEEQRQALEQLLVQLVAVRSAIGGGGGVGAGAGAGAGGGGGGVRQGDGSLDGALAAMQAKTDELAILYDHATRALHAKADSATAAELGRRLGEQDESLAAHRALLGSLVAQLAAAFPAHATAEPAAVASA
mmetsp:Transcript_8572/g.20063  ORF Transcript_8572/g.20063 Transcript_8572/m.20063 type:complete len:672 (+) Transcript_8572:87-2102(+)